MECVKCGFLYNVQVESCTRCTWPFSRKAWTVTEFEIKKLSLDTNCINAKQEDVFLNKLETWANAGLLILQKSDYLLAEIKGSAKRSDKAKSLSLQPEPIRAGRWRIGDSRQVISGPDMEEKIREILFPTTKVINENQNNDVQHLRSHVMVGGQAFITKNTNDFIKHGKQQELSQLGVWVFEPKEIVELLQSLYAWS